MIIVVMILNPDVTERTTNVKQFETSFTEEGEITNSLMSRILIWDTAIAAFLSSVLNADKPETAVRYATIAGRNSLYCDSIFDNMSSWEELTLEINSESNELILFNNER